MANPGSGSSATDLVGLSDYVWQRTRNRLEGLSDEEYLWEPVPGCWSVRDGGDGVFHADGVQPPPAPPPFTTIAWRLAHLTGCYGADRNGRFLGMPLEPPVLDEGGIRPATAGAAIDLLGRAHDRWRRHLTAVTDEALAEPLGPVAGPYAEGSRASFVLHMIDEFIHHGAEVAVLRDLHRATTSSPVEPASVAEAAAAGRWDLVVALAAQGLPVDEPGPRTALHLAAGTGPLQAVKALVERGAGTTATDADFGATPLGWAEYFGNREVAAYLERLDR